MRCGAVQCGAVRCSALRCIAVHCSALQCIAVRSAQCARVCACACACAGAVYAVQCIAVHYPVWDTFPSAVLSPWHSVIVKNQVFSEDRSTSGCGQSHRCRMYARRDRALELHVRAHTHARRHARTHAPSRSQRVDTWRSCHRTRCQRGQGMNLRVCMHVCACTCAHARVRMHVRAMRACTHVHACMHACLHA